MSTKFPKAEIQKWVKNRKSLTPMERYEVSMWFERHKPYFWIASGVGGVFLLAILIAFSSSNSSDVADRETGPASNASDTQKPVPLLTSPDAKPDHEKSPSGAEGEIVGLVVNIADGDTFTLLDDQKQQHKVRLHGIDSPEGDQPFGDKAKQALADKVFQKRVRVVKTDRDKYGRTVAEIYLDDRLINKELVEEGWAWHFREYSSSLALSKAESKARISKNGLWSVESPIPPWDWRKGTRLLEGKAKTSGQASTAFTAQPSKPVSSEPKNESKASNYAKSLVAELVKKGTRQVTEQIPVTVYISNTGSKYHSGSCRYGSRAVSLSSARAKGLTACKICGGGGYGGTRTRTLKPQASLDGKSRFDEELQEWKFTGKFNSKPLLMIVFYSLEKRWSTRLLVIGNEILHSDTETNGFGKTWAERRAEGLLSKAQDRLDEKEDSLAATYLEELIRKYPNTEEAKTAKAKLDKLEQADPELAIKPATNPETERKAQGKLRLAKQLFEKDKSKGAVWLRELIEDYPKTRAAKQAAALLGQ